jgi:flagellar export protein FliJ
MNTRWFRLQSVLDLRASALEDAQNSLGLALASLGAARNDCDQARCEADAIAERICSAATSQSASQSHAARQSFLRQTRHVQALHNRVQECQETVQKRRMQVVKASREHEILVRLREKRLKAAESVEVRKEENLLNDLMNSQRFQTLCQNPGEFLQT